jgi:hypothetical protein
VKGARATRVPSAAHALHHIVSIHVATDGEADAALQEAAGAGAVVGTTASVSSPPKVPRRDFQSVGFTPDTNTRIRTSPSPGSETGRSTSSSTDRSPRRAYVTARMLAPGLPSTSR